MVGCVVSVVCGNDQDKIIISGYIWADYPPPPPRNSWHTTGYGQQAVGTHPTGMLSCFRMCLEWKVKCRNCASASNYGFNVNRLLKHVRSIVDVFGKQPWNCATHVGISVIHRHNIHIMKDDTGSIC